MWRWCRGLFQAGILGALALLGQIGAACAQSPAGRETLLNGIGTKGLQAPAGLACDSKGLCLVTWGSLLYFDDDPGKFRTAQLGAATLSPAGNLLKAKILVEDPYLHGGDVLRIGQSFGVFWDISIFEPQRAYGKPFYQLLDHQLEPRSTATPLPDFEAGWGSASDIELVPGGFVQLAPGSDLSLPDSSDGAFLAFSDFAGRKLRTPVRVSPQVIGEQRVWLGGLTFDPEDRILTAVYGEHISGEDADSDIFYRRFSLTGEPLTPAVRVNSYLPDWQIYPAVATAPNGDFIVTWSSDEQDGSHYGIFGQRFSREGVPLGPEFQVNEVTFSDQIRSQIETDAAGNFLIVWESYDPSAFGSDGWNIKARLYRADGNPAGPEVFINKHRENEQQGPLISWASNGSFVIAWNSYAQVPPANDNLMDAFARRFSASPADEPCIATTGKLSCDTGRTGGELEVQHAFGGAGSGLPFLGDIDGDGREDPCLYSGGIFRCDADHEGGVAEILIPFTVPGAAMPLLGDMDGDGREDPCLFGAGTFHCDTRHDGGGAEVRIVFGQKGETPLLGDVDGDGRDDACAFAGGLFRCDTAHNGGKAELFLRFGRKGDQPLLGDFDGDGRDDPCVFRKGKLLCDTAHNGGIAEGTLSLGGAKDRAVLGNLDGL